jgi:hypothetical protein
MTDKEAMRKLVYLISQIERATPLKNLTQESLFLDIVKPSKKKELVNTVINKWKKNIIKGEALFLTRWLKEVCEHYQTNDVSWMLKDTAMIVDTYRNKQNQLAPSLLRAMVDDSVIEVSNAVAYNLLHFSWMKNATQIQQQLWLNQLSYDWWWRFRAQSYGIRRLWIRTKYGIDRIWINWPNN